MLLLKGCCNVLYFSLVTILRDINIVVKYYRLEAKEDDNRRLTDTGRIRTRSEVETRRTCGPYAVKGALCWKKPGWVLVGQSSSDESSRTRPVGRQGGNQAHT